jgi:hypothetical protein
MLKEKKQIEPFGFNLFYYNFERPLGGFLVIDETQVCPRLIFNRITKTN